MGSVAAGTACVNGAIVLDDNYEAPSSASTTTPVAATPTTTTTSSLAVAATKNVKVALVAASSSSQAAAPADAPKTTSTSSPPAAATSSASINDSEEEEEDCEDDDDTSSSSAYYGACGDINPDSAKIVAVQYQRMGEQSNGNPMCGKQVHITNTDNGKSVVATVADKCPGCRNENSLDLSVGAFDEIAEQSQGVVPISWYFL